MADQAIVVAEQRLDAVARLYRNGRVHTILASGDHGIRTHDEALAVRLGLEGRGVRRDWPAGPGCERRASPPTTTQGGG